MNSQTISFPAVTSNTRPGAPSVISVLPLGRRCAPLMFVLKRLGAVYDQTSARLTGSISSTREGYDWLHVYSARYLGPNKWHAAGDARFHPDNVIV